jgi:transcriptional regulator with XRE-family HTH domain
MSKGLKTLTPPIMQIFMKMTTQGKGLFLADFRRHMDARGWTISRLSKQTGVDQGQVSKIDAGSFKTFASSVLKICMELGMDPTAYCGATKPDNDRKAIVDSAMSIWDGTHRDAELVVSLLREIAKLRKQGSRGK